MREPKYVVTGLNRLTGEREVISSPHEKFRCETLKLQYAQRYAGSRGKPYIRLRVEPAASEGDLW